MATPAEVVAEERARAESLADTFIAELQTVLSDLGAALVVQPAVDVEFAAVEEPTLQDTSALRTALEARLSGGTGLDSTVEAATWDRAREREAAIAQAQIDEITMADEALGFDFPTGVMAARLDAANQEYHNKVSSINRDIAIKQADLEQQNLRDSIAALVQLYQFLATQDVEHWKALISQNEATKQYVLQAAKINSDILQQNNSVTLDASKVHAQVLAQLVAAAISRVSVSAGVDGRSSTSVGHNYSGQYSPTQVGTITPIGSI